MKMRINAMLSIALVLLATSNVGVLLADTVVEGPSLLGMQADGLKPTSTKSSPEIVEILPEDFKPAFTRDTVIKLNAIVKRSYAVIEGFDHFQRDLGNVEKHQEGELDAMLDKHQLVTINSLEQHAHSALNDMHQAVEALKLSNEHYNVAVLAGMVKFVETVNHEINSFIEKTESTQRDG